MLFPELVNDMRT